MSYYHCCSTVILEKAFAVEHARASCRTYRIGIRFENTVGHVAFAKESCDPHDTTCTQPHCVAGVRRALLRHLAW